VRQRGLFSRWESVAVSIMLMLAGCSHRSSVLKTQRLAPLPQDPFVKVYFNHSQASEYTEPYRQKKRTGDDLETLIINLITDATSTVDVAVQELRLPRVAQALVERHQAGVKVRVIVENLYRRPWSEYKPTEIPELTERESNRYEEYKLLVDTNRDHQITPGEIQQGDALVILRQAGILIIDDTADGSKGTGLMHHKFVVVDGRQVIVTSANFTTSDIHGDFLSEESRGNANNLVEIESPEVAAIFTQEFNEMWGDGPGGKPDSLFGINKPFQPAQTVQLGQTSVTVQFSPTGKKIPWQQSSNGLIAQTLSQAAQSVDLALFVFSEQQLANVLESRHLGGVKVRALIDPGFAYRNYSEALDMMGVALGEGCKFEANNRPWQQPLERVGVPQLPAGDVLHHKYGVIDSRVVITGSHNWSDAANKSNDETVLIIDSPVVAAHYVREFQRLYSGARLGVPATVQQKVEAQKGCPPTVAAPMPVSVPVGEVAGGKVNLNTATQAELEALPGVGPKLAMQIIATRQQKPFTSLEDLDQVPGVGPKLLEKLRDQVTW
jgi:competence ComEA-like helix-hairpin-helix protein